MSLLPAGAQAQFSIREGRLFQGDEPIAIRAISYSARPVSGTPGRFVVRSCELARDFPLVRATGANTVFVEQSVEAGLAAVSRAAKENGLLWIATFSLDRHIGSGVDLGDTSSRLEILNDFRDFVERVALDEQLVAVAFGRGSATRYEEQTGRDPRDFYTLLADAGALLRESESGLLLTSVVGHADEVGAFAWASDDASQTQLDFWSIEAPGARLLRETVNEARIRTNKPVLLSSVGIDAFDARVQAEDAVTQANATAELAREAGDLATNTTLGVIGAAWADFSDQWWREDSATTHDANGIEREGFPDRSAESEWFGLFRRRQDFVGESLTPRPAYFELANAWGGSPPVELTDGVRPRIAEGGWVNAATGFGRVAPGSLVEVRGDGFAVLADAASNAAEPPRNLGAVSACVGGEALRLYSADDRIIRGVLSEATHAGEGGLVVYRAGRISNSASAVVADAAPGILPEAVFRPGKPCPVDEQNGVQPGSYLEVYGTGLGDLPRQVVAGLVDGQPIFETVMPEARIDSGPIQVAYSGDVAGAPGINQVNVLVSPDAPDGVTDLRLFAGGNFSNAHRFAVVSGRQQEQVSINIREPIHLVLQEGGAAQSALVDIKGLGGYCSLVRFEVVGLPPGIEAVVPVGLPGQTVQMSLRAAIGTPLLDGAVFVLRTLSVGLPPSERTFRLTVLPAQGDVTLGVVSGGWLSGVPVARFSVEERTVFETHGGGPGRGFNFLTVDAQSGVLGQVHSFDTWQSAEATQDMENFLRSLPEGVLVLGAIADDGALRITEETQQLIADILGAGLISELRYQWSWAIISRKGAARPIAEGLRPNGTVVLNRLVSFPLPALP